MFRDSIEDANEKNGPNADGNQRNIQKFNKRTVEFFDREKSCFPFKPKEKMEHAELEGHYEKVKT